MPNRIEARNKWQLPAFVGGTRGVFVAFCIAIAYWTIGTLFEQLGCYGNLGFGRDFRIRRRLFHGQNENLGLGGELSP